MMIIVLKTWISTNCFLLLVKRKEGVAALSQEIQLECICWKSCSPTTKQCDSTQCDRYQSTKQRLRLFIEFFKLFSSDDKTIWDFWDGTLSQGKTRFLSTSKGNLDCTQVGLAQYDVHNIGDAVICSAIRVGVDGGDHGLWDFALEEAIG